MLRHPSRFTGAPSLLLGAAVAVVAAVAVLVPATAAVAVDPTPTPTPGTSGAAGGSDANIGPATPGEAVCTLASSTLTQISGMIATEQGTVVVEGRDTNTLQLFTLDASCKATAKTYAGVNPRDPQDLAVGSDGTIWVGDIGDEAGDRPSIAIHKIAASGSTAVPNRMTYPDEPGVPKSKDAAAFLINGDDLPLILARVNNTAGVTIYKPSKALVPNATTNLPALTKVGEFVPVKTGTSNPTLESTVTGAAKSPDGKKVVIRTYSDAYEWDVPDGDVVKAITTTKARITRLPDEPQGEAIAYSTDGTKFLTLSAKPTSATENPKLLRYTPFVPAAADQSGDQGQNVPPAPGGEQSWFEKLSLSELTRIVAAVGVVGLVLAIAGILGIRRARKRRREEEEEYGDYDDYDDRPPRRGRRGRGRDDDAFGGPYSDGYDDQYGGAYADAGYGGGGGYTGYAEPGYGGQSGGAVYGNGNANGYGQQGADAYGEQYAPDPYGGQQYGPAAPGSYEGYGQQYGGDPYGGQQQYGGEYGAQGQQYGGGYGHEEDFDPLQDPRRR